MPYLAKQIKSIPKKPGSYIFKDKNGRILYIGKAKNLQNRVKSYWQKSARLEASKQIMVRRVCSIETIVTKNEVEALLLEASLIKQHRPAFNVVLRDDKFYVYLKINLKDDFPTVQIVRRVLKDGSKYFGPYTSTAAVKDALRLVRRIFPYKNCSNPPEKPCLGFHIKRCLGHTAEGVTKKEYQEIIKNVISFLEGRNTKIILKNLQQQMTKASGAQNYERAARLRDQIHSIERLIEKQDVYSQKDESQDIFGLARNSQRAVISLLQIRGGKLLAKDDYVLDKTAKLDSTEIVSSFLAQYYSQAQQFPREIITPCKPEEQSLLTKITKAQITIPQRGRKLRLTKMALANASHKLASLSWEEEGKERLAEKSLEELAEIVKSKSKLSRIEAFDISNIQGNHAVGSMVVFRNGRHDKSQYRKFKIQTVRGANDTAMMKEVLERRFSNLHKSRIIPTGKVRDKSNWPKPDLILLDGGKPQLSSGLSVLKILGLKIPIIALTKRCEEIFIPNRKMPIILSSNSPALKLIQRIRDEAHRFAVQYYRTSHGKASISSALDEIPSIGPKKKRELIKAFGSVNNIKTALDQDLEKIVGSKSAKNLRENL